MWTVATPSLELRGDVPLRERRRRHLIELGVLPDDPDDDEEADQVTTTEVELVAEAEPAPNGLGVPVVVVSEPESPARSCQGCGAPLTGRPFQKWCSAKCRKRTVRSAPKAQVGRMTAEVLGSPSTVNHDLQNRTPEGEIPSNDLQNRAPADDRPRGTRTVPPAPPAAPQADVFRQLIAVAQGLPAGVQVDELSPAGFTLRWAP